MNSWLGELTQKWVSQMAAKYFDEKIVNKTNMVPIDSSYDTITLFEYNPQRETTGLKWEKCWDMNQLALKELNLKYSVQRYTDNK